MNWREPPTYEEVQQMLRRQAQLKAQLEMLEYQIQEREDELAEDFPKKPAERRKRMKDMLLARVQLRSELYEVTNNVSFNGIRKDMFEITSRKANQL